MMFFMKKLFKGSDMVSVISRGGMTVFSIRSGGKLFTLVSQIFIAVSIGLHSYGRFIFAISIAHVLVIPAVLGLDRAVMRLIPAYTVKKEWGLLRGLLRQTIVIPLTVSLVIASFFAATVFFLGDTIGEELSETFYWTCLLLPLISLTHVQVANLLAFKKPVTALLPFYILRPILIIIFLFVQINLAGLPADSVTAVQAVFLALAAIFIMNQAGLHGRKIPPFRKSKPQFATLKWLSFTLQLLLVAGFVQLLADIDIIMVGALLGTIPAGIYGAATRIAAFVALGLHSVNTIIAPLISQYHTEGDIGKLQRLASSSCLIVSSITAAGALCLVVFGEFALSLFGDAFSAGFAALLILALGQLVNAITGSGGQFINLTGHQKVSIPVLGGSVILNVTLNAILIPVLHILGAAVSTAITVSILNIVMMLLVKKRLGIDPSILSVFKDGRR